MGPVAFVTSWALAAPGYDDRSWLAVTRGEPISRLAAADAPQQWLVTCGLVAFGLGVLLARAAVTGRVLRAALATVGLSSLVVAATPLEAGLDAPHYVAAGAGYVGLVVVALAWPAAGAARAAGLLAATLGGAALVASLPPTDLSGLWQRTGLTVLDTWLVATCLRCCCRGTGAPGR